MANISTSDMRSGSKLMVDGDPCAVIDNEHVKPGKGQAFNRVEVIREYTYDETGVLGKENEARILRAEMEDELVRQIVLRTIARLAPSVTTTRLAPSVTALSVNNAVGNLASLDRSNAVKGLFH